MSDGEKLIPINIEDQMKAAYIDYSMSVIVSIFFIVSLFFFNYQLNFTGGGVFFQLSNFFFNNNNFCSCRNFKL